MTLVLLGLCTFGLLFAVLFLAAGIGFRVRILQILGWIGIAFCGLPLGIYTLESIQADSHNRVPANVFKDVFSISPPAGVTDLQSDVSGYFDSSRTLLKFHISPVAFQKLASKNWKPLRNTNESENTIYNFENKGLAWWKPGHNKGMLAFTPIARSHSFAYEEEILLYDRSTHTAFYGYQGID